MAEGRTHSKEDIKKPILTVLFDVGFYWMVKWITGSKGTLDQ